MMPAPETGEEKTLKAPRAAAIAGMLFAVLLTISLVLIRRALPAVLSDVTGGSARIDISRSLVVGLNLLPFAGIAFLWFVGVIRDYLGNREDRFFATIVLGSGLLFIGMMFTAAGIAGGLITSITTSPDGTADADMFLFGRAMSYTVASVYAARMAGVFIFSTSALTRRIGLIPRWLAYLGFLAAIVLLVGIGRIDWIFLLFPLWAFVFSVFILIQRPLQPPG